MEQRIRMTKANYCFTSIYETKIRQLGLVCVGEQVPLFKKGLGFDSHLTLSLPSTYLIIQKDKKK